MAAKNTSNHSPVSAGQNAGLKPYKALKVKTKTLHLGADVARVIIAVLGYVFLGTNPDKQSSNSVPHVQTLFKDSPKHSALLLCSLDIIESWITGARSD